MNTLATDLPPREARRPTILVIDDSPTNLEILGEILAHAYNVKVAPSGRRGLELARSLLPDLILLDVMMPGLSGYQVLHELQADEATRDIPTIFVTALDSTHDEAAGLDLGVVDYLTKPVRPAIVLSRIRNHLELAASRERLRDANMLLEAELRRRNRDEDAAEAAVLGTLQAVAGAWAGCTAARTQRVARCTRLVAAGLGLREAELDLLERASTLVDVGMARVPAAVYAATGPLDAGSRAAIQRHPGDGEALLRALSGAAPKAETRALLDRAADIARDHQERWDGSGYPAGLPGEAIPLQARIVGLCSAFAAMLEPRPDRAARGFDEAVAELVAGRGTQFDPAVVDAFLAAAEDIAHGLAAAG